MMPEAPYIGRFAPSPTGDLHFGSLVAAVGSFLQARSHDGLWLIRVEDIDPPREIAGSAERIIADLGHLGMHSDRPVLYQSTRMTAYRHAWQQLQRKGLVFACQCSRGMLPASGVYPGTCRELALADSPSRSLRFRVNDSQTGFDDVIMGHVSQCLAATVGDFVVRRADGLPAYQLAVVVDDAHQGITEVVRGADLLDSTSRQIALQQALKLSSPRYCHLPVAVLPDGSKLSKRLASDPVRSQRPASAIRQALEFLGHTPPAGLGLEALWTWARTHWNLRRVPAQPTQPVPAGMLPR
jgi:glutamyl-Q tRNA(Asp) synthetase